MEYNRIVNWYDPLPFRCMSVFLTVFVPWNLMSKSWEPFCFTKVPDCSPDLDY